MVDSPDNGDCGINNNCLENELIALPSGLCSEDDLEILDQEDGEVIKNVTAAQRTDGSKLVDIYYDLEGVEPYSFYNVHAEIIFSDLNAPLTYCQGDVWHDILPGEGKHMTCDLNYLWNTYANTLSGEYNIKVIAEATAVSEIPFNMVTINGNEVQSYVDDEPTYLVDYDFEIMESALL